jgi:N-acetyl-anhydromuramyl-L-alanine amidase AmpD
MEVCNWGKNSTVGPFREVNKAEGYIVSGKYQSFTKAQEAALINFILWAKTKNKTFDLDYVVGHDELRAEAGKRGDKSDPGGSLRYLCPLLGHRLRQKQRHWAYKDNLYQR